MSIGQHHVERSFGRSDRGGEPLLARLLRAGARARPREATT
jgi:hypothetical protein